MKISAVLLGRERELQAIDQALAGARLGKSSRLVIRGEPGIGKTVLLEHAVAVADSMNILSARGVEFEAGVPFAGLHELLRPALGLIDSLPPMHASALRSSLGLGERIGADRLIVGAGVLNLISSYAEQRPLLITIDDAHWMDLASSEAIAFAARRLIADPVAVLIAVREDEESPFIVAGLPQLRLNGLRRESAIELLKGAATVEMPVDYADWLVQATAGNPLALLELARADPQPLGAASRELPMASSVERAYLRRAETLSAGARLAMLLMAAAGAGDVGLVDRAAAGMGIDVAAVDEAESASWLVKVRGDRVEFAHPLARAAIYHAASPAQRRAAHRALAHATTGADHADRRAWHMAAAASGWDADAAAALEETARRAHESTGYAAAAAALAESARLTEDPELRGSRLFRAAEDAWLGGGAREAVDLLAAARMLARTTEAQVDIDNLDGQIAMRQGSVMEGYRTLTAAAHAIKPTDRLKAIRMLADAALSSFGAGYPDERMTGADEALALVRPDDPPDTTIFALVAYGALAILAGRGADGPQRLRESVRVFAAVPAESVDPLVLMCECIAGLFLREADAGRELLDRVLEVAREHAPTAALPMVLFFLGRDAFATDRWSLARALYEEAYRVASETTQFTWVSGTVAGLAWLDALEGREEECRTHAAEALSLSAQYGMAFYKAWGLIALGQLDLGFGRPRQALDRFLECDAFLDEVAIGDPDLSCAPDIVDALVRLGRMAEARATSERYSWLAREKGLPFSMARAARARALVAGDDAFSAEFDEALRQHEATPDVFERSRTQLYYGERLRRARRRVEARRLLRSALKSFEQLGASPWSVRASTELHASGETARVREDSYRQQLTPQELQVAMTLAEGATTREAAARLYISPKTVEYHLRHVYDKLEIRNREELRSALSGHARSQKVRTTSPDRMVRGE